MPLSAQRHDPHLSEFRPLGSQLVVGVMDLLAVLVRQSAS
jgi:hypothetical protein